VAQHGVDGRLVADEVEDLTCVDQRLLEIDAIREINVERLPDGIDEHLANNIRSWGPDKRTVRRPIHVYLTDGEA
jgi:hypothetical protein